MEESKLKSLQNLAIVALPILVFALIEKGGSLKEGKSFSRSYQDKIKLLKEISPYFLEEDQYILGKVQDIFEILNRVNRIIKSDYTDNVKALNQDLPMLDRKEKILSKLSTYLDDSNRQLAEGVIETKQNILKAKENLEEYSQAVSTQSLDKLTSMMKLAKSIEPLMPSKGKVQLKKIEKIVDIMKASDDEFKPYY
ncbi:hypothetical protein [Proteiniborus sp. MB09-C3]|uniref:hypothetical protein n=1 Tax=Proteiniborus sp. MB09-C3 TaxID=3050072 RepID=UPI0025569E02|nr:hypothetical protein [Proteiniborus sp. MB09-C3]WIV11486.1 hypothetical protein QO263_15500 [Proteiniborus sp. MB09-C3]